MHKQLSPNVVIKQHQSPSTRIVHQGEISSKPSQEYLKHLVPQVPQVTVRFQHQNQKKPENIDNKRIMNPVEQFFENKPNNPHPSANHHQESEINRSKPSYSMTSDRRSCRSLSHHNIHITI